MNFLNMRTGSTRSTGMMGGVIFFIVIIIILYYMYTFFYNSGATQSSINIVPSNVLEKSKLISSGSIRCDSTKKIPGGDSAVAQVTTAGLTSGGQYTVTMWLSVSSTTPESAGTGVIPLLDITSSVKTQLFIGLAPTNGTLVITQGTGDPSNDGQANFYGNSSQGSSSVNSSDDKCNIVNGIEYQRWILIAVTANGRTLDVYVDGKLSRSCVYKGLNDLGVATGNGSITVGRNNSSTGIINGVFSTTEYYNYALTPDIIWGIYQNGPALTNTSSFLANLFSTNIDLSFGTASN